MNTTLLGRASALVLLCTTATARPVAAQGISADLLDQIGIDQRLNEQVPLNLPFRDEQGSDVRLGDFFGDKPVILTLVYYECPMLCTEILNGLVRSLKVLSFDVGKEFEVVTVSFNPAETPSLALTKKQMYLSDYGRPEARDGWHFLTGDEDAIRQLTEAVGFRYVYLPEENQYAHASAIVILTPTGRVSRYFYGIDYPTRDVRLGLVEAAEHRIGSVADQLVLLCLHYDPTTGKYGVVIMNVLRLAGLLTVAVLGTFMTAGFLRDRRQARRAHRTGVMKRLDE